MSERIEGFVAKINTKTGNGRRGAWTLYTGRIEKADGTEYPDWINFGFDAPGFKEGDYISFDVERNDGRVEFVKGSGKKPKNPPARKAKGGGGKSGGGQSGQSGGGRRGGGGGGYAGGGNKFDGSGIQNTMNPIDAQRVGLSAARTAALETVALLLGNNALPLTKAANKAGEAARYDEIMAALDKITVRFYHDTTTGRLLESVADEGKKKAPASADDLPDGDEGAPENGDGDPRDEGNDPATDGGDLDDDIPF